MSVDMNKIREVYRAHIRRVAAAEESATRYARSVYSRLQTVQREHEDAQRALTEIQQERLRAIQDYRREFPDEPITVD